MLLLQAALGFCTGAELSLDWAATVKFVAERMYWKYSVMLMACLKVLLKQTHCAFQIKG